jgi:hypothetical protein
VRGSVRAETITADGNTPGTRARDVVATALIGGVIAFPGIFAGMNMYDGGLASSAGTFILHGGFPYRDFWWLYGPGAPAIEAMFTAIFGPSLLLLRLIGLAFLMGQVGFGYVLLRTRVSHLPAAVITLAAAHAQVFVLGLEPTAWLLSMTLALGSLAVRSAMPQRGALAGILLGLTFLVRFDVGGYALVAALTTPNRRELLVGFGCMAVPVGIVLLALVPVGSLWDQLIWFPIIGQRQFRALPGPKIDDWMVVLITLPLVVVPKLAIVAGAIRLIVTRDRPDAFAMLVIFAGLCQLQTQGRSDIYHHAQASTPGLLLLGLWVMKAPGPDWRPAIARVLERVSARTRRATSAVLVGVVCFTAFATGSLSVATMNVGQLGPQDADFVASVRTLAENSSADDPVFVGLTSHRYTVINPMLAYYLADRRAAVRVSMFNPGVTNTDPVQREMVDNLKAANAQILLLDDRVGFEVSNDSRIPGSTILDEYISSAFVEVCRFGDFGIFAARDGAPGISCVPPRPERFINILGGLG